MNNLLSNQLKFLRKKLKETPLQTKTCTNGQIISFNYYYVLFITIFKVGFNLRKRSIFLYLYIMRLKVIYY